MKKFLIPLLCILILGLSNCKKNKTEDIRDYMLPAIVGYNFDLNHVTLKTPIETFLAPQLDQYFIFDLEDGDPLWVYLSVNYDQQPFEGHIGAFYVEYLKIRKETPQATNGGESTTDDFGAPIEIFDAIAMINDKHFGNSVAFFLFTHTVHGSNSFIYEMTYDPDETSDDHTYSVYFRAKKDVAGVKPLDPFKYLCAFDLRDFLLEKRDAENKVKINIFFKTGEKDGEDIYDEYIHNPLELDFE
jgi:hypothetical protein